MRLRAYTIATAAVVIGAGSQLPVRANPVDVAPPPPVPAVVTPAPVAPAIVAAAGSRPATAPTAETRVVSRVETALSTLGSAVKEKSDPGALRMAFQAYYNYRTSHPKEVRKPYLYFVDYGLDARTPRGYVFDMDLLRVIDGPFTVAHGRGSDRAAKGMATTFSSRQGSAATSLGLYMAENTYSFSGKSAGQRYSSIGLRLRGLSGRFNSSALSRGVVVHGAPYVTPTKAGRSEGCPAMEQSRAKELIPKLASGSLVYLFSPLDATWLREEPWANGAGMRVATGD